MNKLLLSTAILFMANNFSVKAQETAPVAKAEAATETKAAHKAARATRAYARGDDSYLSFGNEYKPGTKYIVIKFWNAKEALTEAEKTELTGIKNNLGDKNVEIVEFEWKDEADLKERLKGYNLNVKVSDGKHINVSSESINLNTTSGNALLVMSENKAVSVCSGKHCGERLKRFFKLKSTD